MLASPLFVWKLRQSLSCSSGENPGSKKGLLAGPTTSVLRNIQGFDLAKFLTIEKAKTQHEKV